MFFMHGEFFPWRANNTHTPFFLGGTLFAFFGLVGGGGGCQRIIREARQKRSSFPLCGRRLNLNPQVFLCIHSLSSSLHGFCFPLLPPRHSLSYQPENYSAVLPSPSHTHSLRKLKGGILPGKTFRFFQKNIFLLCDSKQEDSVETYGIISPFCRIWFLFMSFGTKKWGVHKFPIIPAHPPPSFIQHFWKGWVPARKIERGKYRRQGLEKGGGFEADPQPTLSRLRATRNRAQYFFLLQKRKGLSPPPHIFFAAHYRFPSPHLFRFDNEKKINSKERESCWVDEPYGKAW